MELEEFKAVCNSKKCLKRQRYEEKTCSRESKQTNCWKAYERLEAKKVQTFEEQKEEWKEQEDFNNEIWLRDTGEKKGDSSKRDNWKNYCRIWKILSNEEKSYLENNDEELFLNSKLEVAHIKAKSIDLENKYNIENCVLIGHTFHRRLTDMIHPVYKTPISSGEVEIWLNSAKNGKVE